MPHTYQFVLLPILLGLVFYLLKQFKIIWFSKDYSFEEKQQKLVLYQILLCISVFATKMCICFDHKIQKPWIDGAFARISNRFTFAMSFALSGNAVISYHIFGPDIVSMISLSILTIFQLWVVLGLMGRDVRPLISRKPKVLISDDICNTLSEEYRQQFVFEQIGWNQFGTTYRTEWTRLANGQNNSSDEIQLAVKVIDMNAYRLFHLDYSPQDLIRNNCEYRLLTQISHRNIAPFLKIKRIPPEEGEPVRQLVLVSKLAPFSLDSYISTICQLGVGQRRAQLWFRQLVDAVYYLHLQFNKDEAIPHLSIKPENILLFRRNDEEFDVKLNDCGLEKYFTKLGQITTDNNQYLISPPEFIYGRKVIRANKKRITPTQALAADIFSLGVILFVLIKGKVEGFYKNTNEGSERIIESDAILKYVNFSWKNWKKSSLKSVLRNEENRPIISSLFKGMLQKNWEKRFDITSVRNHSWLNLQFN